MDFKKKVVLVTGADGFIGSHLVELLLEEGCQVKAFCFYNSFNSWGWLDNLPEEKLQQDEIFTGDIRAEIAIGELTPLLIDTINPAARIIQDKQCLRPAKSEFFRLYAIRT